MKTILSILIAIFFTQTSFSQVLTAAEKKQVALISQAILYANQKEREKRNAEAEEKTLPQLITEGILNANKIEKEAKAEAAAKNKLALIINKGINDTIVIEKNYESETYYKNKEHISFEVKDGIMYAKFKADVQQEFIEDKKIENYHLVMVSDDKKRKITVGDSKVLVYATPAVRGEFLSTGKWGWSVGLLTVPFKIRPATNNIPSESKADIKNINLFLGRNYNTERIFWNQLTSSHRWMFGVMGGISSETLTNLNTDEPAFKDRPTNQAYMTLAMGIGYSYKDKISLMFLPAGADIGFSDTSKKWIYNGNYWWGLGIGLDFSGLFHFSKS
ncbi:MAG: hypothetical protein ABIQ27_07240 [Flavobacterium sp.]|uniref:hypothetical protein n=1 Tax=Flavobacterium sp. TaxID=239 RepID=UPI00326301B8